MANNIAAEWPVDNDGLWWCEITEQAVNLTTGDIEENPVTGRNDVVAFACASPLLDKTTADAIHADLVLPLTNIAGTNRYYAYPQGHLAKQRLLPTYKDQQVYIHFVAGTGDWHEVAETTVVDLRTAV